jgi:6-phosphogluconate dehydrogenase
MQLGMIGLGRMGANMARRMMRDGHHVVVYDRNTEPVQALASEGATGAVDLEELVEKLTAPRAVWVMLPAGEPTDTTVLALKPLLSAGDVIIDGGNSYFKDDVRRGRLLKESGIYYLDVGTSGGVWGLQRGYCLMIGGEPEAFRQLEPVFATLAPGEETVGPSPGREKIRSTAEKGYLHCGPVGAGHFVKMIHNGIEYGLMQAYAEGFDILRGAGGDIVDQSHRYSLNLADIAEVWRRGSVVGSWLLDLTAISLASDPELKQFSGFVQDSGEGRWTVLAAMEEAISAEVLTASLYKRFRSRVQHTYAEKLLSAMRFQFGGHQEPHMPPQEPVSGEQ